MLLNELQKRTQENVRQAEELGKLSAQMAGMSAKLSTLEEALGTNNANGKLADASPGVSN